MSQRLSYAHILTLAEPIISVLCFFLITSFVCRLVLSRFEIEEPSLGENSVESEEDEEEVWLFWKDSNKVIRSRSIRELAQDAKEGQKEDQEVISYYRYSKYYNAQHNTLNMENEFTMMANYLCLWVFKYIFLSERRA